ncbi:ABC transporter G family member 45-like isoform X2 [Carex rostrata]
MKSRDEPPLTHADNEEFLRMLRERNQRMCGDEATQVEVRFENLTVEAEMQTGRQALPTLLNATLNGVEEIVKWSCLYAKKKYPIRILNELSGMIRPSRLTLVLGPPGSGKSTFLQALSGNICSNMKLKGKIMYNGEELNSSTPQHMKAYVSQFDWHHPEMTVRETLNFSSHLLQTNNTFEMLGENIGRNKAAINKMDLEFDTFVKATTCGDGSNLITNYIIKMLGLNECADLIIGDELRRGISGGEKKRVTIGEMLVGMARCFFMDDVSTGLDSSTTFDIIKYLKQMAHLMDLTMVISLLQPPPETFELFDDIILLCEGQIVYQGPREYATEFFDSIRFKCPKRKNVADFLLEVTSKKDQEQYWAGNPSEYHYQSTKKLAESFRSFCISRMIQNQSNNRLITNSSTKSIKIWRISKWQIFLACFSRELLLLKRNSPLHIFKTIQISFVAFVITTLFLRTRMNHQTVMDGNIYLGASFMGIMVVNFNGMTELAMTIKRLPIFFKQRELLNLPGWVVLSSIFILSIPSSLLETGIYTGLTYYGIGFTPSPTRFFRHFLILFAIHQMSMSLYRFIATVTRTQVVANVVATAALTTIILFAGFLISGDDIQPWLQWGYWISPFSYSLNAIALNEFLDSRWSTEFHYGNMKADTIGKAVLEFRGLFTAWHWFWISVVALFGFSLVFNILSIFALEFLNPPYKRQAIKPENEMQEIELACKSGLAPGQQVVLPFQPLTLVFKHISYFVNMPKEMEKYGVNEKRLQLLHDVSGAFQPGVLTALMGVTGAGKTTLLDVLAGRKTGGYIEGTISIEGFQKNQQTFSKISGYCEQTDIHSPFVTVYESLQYCALLRLPSNVKPQERYMIIEEVMLLVELSNLRNAMVGVPGQNGLSTEQRKRLTIAVELISSPSIIFMDEPTTGLDARAAAIVMRAIRKTVDTGRTVVCTIHQPSIEIFEAFDELMLMKKGGQLLYSGSLGPFSSNMIQYFESIPGVPKIIEDQNPAAWMLNVSSQTMEYMINVDYAEIFQNSSLYKSNKALIEELDQPKPGNRDLHFPKRYWQGFSSQCLACLWKNNCTYWKNPDHNVARFVNTFAMALLLGTVFWQIGSDITSEQDVFNILGIAYGSALFLGFANANMMQPVIAMERAVFYRERSAGMYSSVPYAIAQMAIEVPYMMVQVFIFCTIIYSMVGFQFTVVKFLWFILFITLSFMYYTLYGMMCVALTPNIEIAGGVAFLVFVLWNVFSGFIISIKMIPPWWRWLYWADPAAWTVYGLMFSQLGDRTELVKVPPGPDIPVKEFIRDYLGLHDKYFNLIISLHIVAIMLFGFIYCICIKYLNFQRR